MSQNMFGKGTVADLFGSGTYIQNATKAVVSQPKREVLIRRYLEPVIYTIVEKRDKSNNVSYELEKTKDRFEFKNKLYGKTEERAKMYVDTFKAVGKSFGISLTGHAGTGKTEEAKLVCNELLDMNFAVIMITDIVATIELVHFINSLENVVLLFEEFGKNFNIRLQDKMLTMFNDMTNNVRFTIITDNNKNGISSFILNRPGRIHYDIEFARIGLDLIEDYLKENPMTESVKKDMMKAYDKALTFSIDHLQAIVLENTLRPHLTFEEIVDVVNIKLFRPKTTMTVVSVLDTKPPKKKKEEDTKVFATANDADKAKKKAAKKAKEELTKTDDKKEEEEVEPEELEFRADSMLLSDFEGDHRYRSKLYIWLFTRRESIDVTKSHVVSITEEEGSGRQTILCKVNDRYEVSILIDE